MKILILSHTRCGSTTLCKWLSNELNIVLDETRYNYKTFNSVFKLDNVIRKVVIEEYHPTKEDISKFDKIIYLTRDDITNAAISCVMAKITSDWHVSYEVTSEWIDKNKKQILEEIYRYQTMKSNMKKYDGFNLTYEDVYINKSAITKILEYIGIISPNHLDMLDYNKKYRKDNNVFIKKYNGLI
jgi:LPS sulfotransferase NodH